MRHLLLLLCLTCWLPLWHPAQAQTLDSTLTQRSSPYRYVNATSLKLRSRPDATAATSATIAGASRVQLLGEDEEGWSHVQVAAVSGYVRSEYLVEEQDQVSADIDWTTVEAAGGAAYSSLAPTSSQLVRRTATAAPKPAASPKVYVCGNGRTEVYHSSTDCAAMRRCTYQALVMSQREAQTSGLRGCMKCY
jgi:cytoskeletal protein RodZ